MVSPAELKNENHGPAAYTLPVERMPLVRSWTAETISQPPVDTWESYRDGMFHSMVPCPVIVKENWAVRSMLVEAG